MSEKQKKLDSEEDNDQESEEDVEEATDDHIVEENDLFDDWLDEVDERLERVEKKFNPSRRDTEMIKDKAIRPFYYFKEDRLGEDSKSEEPITDKQKSYLLSLEDQSPQRFWKYANNVDAIDPVGPPEEVAKKLTKSEASKFIDFLNSKKELEDFLEEGSD